MLAFIDRQCLKFHQAYENNSYDFFSNGEAEILSKLNSVGILSAIFDVGANVGEWSRIAARTCSGADIYSFEPVPKTYSILEKNCKSFSNIHPFNVGLSNADEQTYIYCSAEFSELATCIPEFAEEFHGITPEKISVNTFSGDSFCDQHSIENIDFLKMDVEGYESRVLEGFKSYLRQNRIKAIQLEYGMINISTRFLLKDIFGLMNSYNMRIGKIYPNYVDFREYCYADEDFMGPNYLAVHESQDAWIDALAG